MENQPKMNIITRSRGLLKKASELATLCGIDVCLIFYDHLSSSTAPALTFPSDPSQVSRILSHYQSHTGRVKDETPENLLRQRTEPEIDLVDSRAQTAIDCVAEQRIDGDPIRTPEMAIDCVVEQRIDGEPIRTPEMAIDCVAEQRIDGDPIRTPEMAIECAAEQRIDGDPIRTLVDLVDEWFAKAERIGSKENGIRSFLRREEALRRIAEDLCAILYSVNNRISVLLSRNMDEHGISTPVLLS